jgi:hypothetical protein
MDFGNDIGPPAEINFFNRFSSGNLKNIYSQSLRYQLIPGSGFMEVFKIILKGVAVAGAGIVFTILVSMLIFYAIASVSHHDSCARFGDSWKCNYMVTTGIMTESDVILLDEVAGSQDAIADTYNRASFYLNTSSNFSDKNPLLGLLMVKANSKALIDQTRNDYDHISSIEVSPAFADLKSAYLDYLLNYQEFSIYLYDARVPDPINSKFTIVTYSVLK